MPNVESRIAVERLPAHPLAPQNFAICVSFAFPNSFAIPLGVADAGGGCRCRLPAPAIARMNCCSLFVCS
jgi:hypothetical protein